MFLKTIKVATALSIVTAGSTFGAGKGLDRSGAFTQDVNFILDSGDFVSTSMTSRTWKVTGVNSQFLGAAGGVAGAPITQSMANFTKFSLEAKWDVNEKTALGFKYDQPYGAQVEYVNGGPFVAGTVADSSWWEVTALARTELAKDVKIFAGYKIQNLQGSLTTFIPAPADAFYKYQADSSTEYGYTLGAAYEIPEIYFRAAVSYNSAIEHNGGSIETLGGSPLGPNTENRTTAPASVNVSLRTAVTPETIVFANYRQADWGNFSVYPPLFKAFINPRSALYLGEDGNDMSYGAARVINDKLTLVGLFSDTKSAYSDASVLQPYNGSTSYTFIANYKLNDKLTLIIGGNSTEHGDAWIEDVPMFGASGAQAEFRNNTSSALQAGLKYSF
jgi:long-subunit fatty acid transport protein